MISSTLLQPFVFSVILPCVKFMFAETTFVFLVVLASSARVTSAHKVLYLRTDIRTHRSKSIASSFVNFGKFQEHGYYGFLFGCQVHGLLPSADKSKQVHHLFAHHRPQLHILLGHQGGHVPSSQGCEKEEPFCNTKK